MFSSKILVILLAIQTIEYVRAQPVNNNGDPYADNYSLHFNSAVAGIVIVFISGFFFLCFFAIYLRRCGGASANSQVHTNQNPLRTNPGRGLDSALLDSFPTMKYTEVKNLKTTKGALECAICLSEFSDDDTLRLLPGCSHVFHVDCIDVWLETKVTCPVCRLNLSDPPVNSEPNTNITDSDQNSGQDVELGEPVIGDYRRWNTTGHVLAAEATERYTLRLPEEMRIEMVRRARSVRDGATGQRRWSWGSFLLPTFSGPRTAAGPPERAGSKRVFPAGGEVSGSGRGGGSVGMKARSGKEGEGGSTTVDDVV